MILRPLSRSSEKESDLSTQHSEDLILSRCKKCHYWAHQQCMSPDRGRACARVRRKRAVEMVEEHKKRYDEIERII